jgi:very-short-patch-repair endonuclease
MDQNNNYYNKNLKRFARANRNNSTLAEVLLWTNLLKARGLKGYQFLRQRTIDNFIVDFFCKELNLVIEVDGITHEQKTEEDKERQIKLESMGYSVQRFKDEDVIGDFLYVKRKLEEWIEEYEIKNPEVLKYKKRNRRSSPSPLPRGKKIGKGHPLAPSKGEKNWKVIPLAPSKGE